MKQYFKTLLLNTGIVLSMLMTACSEKPEPCIIIDNKSSELKAGLPIQFNATCSKDADTYKWDFGDGTVSSGATVQHKFTSAGTHMVLMTASNKKQSVTTSKSVILIAD